MVFLGYHVYVIFCLLICAEAEFKFTYKMASQCKEHICERGYSYETYYRVQSSKTSSEDTLLEMHLAILASSNGHILLSPVPFPEPNDPVYEIVIGGGGNKFTELRRNLRRNAKTSAHTLGILSSVEFRAFYIKVSEDGQIEFGKEGESLPLLTYFDSKPLAIKYFSFAAWNGVEAKFLYDCPDFAENETEAKPNSEVVEPKISKSEKLKRTLLMDRQPTPPNSGLVNLNLGIKITNLRYDTMETKLTTSLALVMNWVDDSLAWDPEKFNGTSKLLLRQGQIWTPDFIVLNSDDVGILQIRDPEPVSLLSTGEALSHAHTSVKTWCTGDRARLNKWPYDKYVCYIVMSSWEVHENFNITLLKADDEKMQKFSAFDEPIVNEWDMKYKISIVTAKTWNRIYSFEANQTSQGDKVTVQITLSRKGTTFYLVFFTPLFVLTAFVLLSFWSEPLQTTRIWCYSCLAFINVAGMCNLDYIVPCHTIPLILILYLVLLAAVILALTVQVILMTSHAKKILQSNLVQSVLTSRTFRLLFFLPTIKTGSNYESFNDSSANLEDEDGIYTEIPASIDGNRIEMETETISYGNIAELAEVFDKAMFFLYSMVFCFLFARYS